ncbi:MAG: hypothetical protein ABEK59_02490 [Halobacteria archaeon]
MTAAELLGKEVFREPEDAAEYFRYGADYVLDVSRDMGWRVGDLQGTIECGYHAMKNGDTEVDPETARLIGAVLIGDAEYWRPLGRWFPRGYRLLMRGLEHGLRRKLLRLAGIYTDTVEFGGKKQKSRNFFYAYPEVRQCFGTPEFTLPGEVLVEGSDPRSYVDGFTDHVILGDSVLHTEWYSWVAQKMGIDVNTDLVEKTRNQSLYYFTGNAEVLSEDVRRFQETMFSDYSWIRGIQDEYDLNSILFDWAADGIEETVDELRYMEKTA